MSSSSSSSSSSSELHSQEFAGLRVIVTGASSGIGLATAKYYHSRGASVVLIARRKQLLDSIVAELGPKSFAVAADVTDHQSLDSSIRQSIELLGGLDVLVNNAGGLGSVDESVSPTDVWNVKRFESAFSLNVLSIVVASNAAIDSLIESKGSIVNVSSVVAKFPASFSPAYCASKAAVDSVTQSYSLVYAPKGVRVNSVNPATIDTPIFEGWGLTSEQVSNSFGALHALGRVGHVDEVAASIAFLSSKGASFITGVNLLVDGGANITRWFNKPQQ